MDKILSMSESGKYLVKRELSLNEEYLKYVYGHTIPNELEVAELIIKDGTKRLMTESGRVVDF